MIYYLIAAALVLHTAFWGLGLAWLIVPRVWRRWWWALTPGCGLALQSAIVWMGAHTRLAGTDTYAAASEFIPVVLLGLAIWRRGWPTMVRHLRTVWIARGLLALVILAGGLLLWPMAQRGAWTLTSSSLGSCDHADYAAGARVLQEFSRNDRVGFLGLPEVTRVGGTEMFFDYWLRLNHFTPSALIAHNGTVMSLQPHQLVSVSGVAVLLLNAALVLLLARMAVGIRGAAGLLPVAIYLFSPLGAYAVHHGALGQLYAAHGIALLTLAIVGAGGAVRQGRSVWPWAPLVLAAFWILAGSYNFILLVALAPAGAWLLAEIAQRRDWRGPGRVVGLLLVTLVVGALLFWGRFEGLIDRFKLLKQESFGWQVPLLSPEGWVGLLRSTELTAWAGSVRVLLSATVGGLWLVGVALLWRRRRADALAALALVLPVLAGWAVLAWESRTRLHASYDAFKLFSVFYPGLLAGFMAGLGIVRDVRARWMRGAVWVAMLSVVAGNLWVAGQFARLMAVPPLRVERGLLDLQHLENMPQVTSLNLHVEDVWSRLWANAFLLRKPQYFPIHTYEGRRNTELKGEWDLSDSMLRSLPTRETDAVDLNAQFYVVRVGASGHVTLTFGDGWYRPEGLGLNRWRWSTGSAGIRVNNRSAEPLKANLAMRVRSPQAGRLSLGIGGTEIGVPRSLDGSIQRLEFEGVVIPPGDSILTLRNDQSANSGEAGDSRQLGVALYELTVRAVP